MSSIDCEYLISLLSSTLHCVLCKLWPWKMYFRYQAVVMNAIDHRRCIPEQVLQLLSASKQTLLLHVALPVLARLISLLDKSSLNKETSLRADSPLVSLFNEAQREREWLFKLEGCWCC